MPEFENDCPNCIFLAAEEWDLYYCRKHSTVIQQPDEGLIIAIKVVREETVVKTPQDTFKKTHKDVRHVKSSIPSSAVDRHLKIGADLAEKKGLVKKKMSLKDIKNLIYQGSGWFRLPIVDGKLIPKGKNAPIIHGPELHQRMLELLRIE